MFCLIDLTWALYKNVIQEFYTAEIQQSEANNRVFANQGSTVNKLKEEKRKPEFRTSNGCMPELWAFGFFTEETAPFFEMDP